jgi:hypothetical protein
MTEGRREAACFRLSETPLNFASNALLRTSNTVKEIKTAWPMISIKNRIACWKLFNVDRSTWKNY